MTTIPATRWAMPVVAALALLLLAGCTEDAVAPTVSPTATATGTPATTATTTATASPTATATGTAEGGTTIPAPSPDGTRYTYLCAEARTFQMIAYPAEQERATLIFEGKSIELKQERSGSGVRYAGEGYTLIAKGLDAMIEENGTATYRDCKGQPQ